MIKIKTDLLKSIVSKAVKVCSFNKMLPLTELMEINVEGEKLTVRTTDNITNLFLIGKIEGNTESMRVVLDATLFNALINKITTEYIELIITDNALTVNGNGVYTVDVRIDETGEIIKFADVSVDSSKATKALDYKELVKRMTVCKAAIPDNFDAPELNNYYLKDKIITTNAFKVTCVDNISGLVAEELFISKDLGRIIIDLGFEAAKYYVEDNKLVIMNDEFILTSKIGQDLEKFPLDAIKMMLNQSFTYDVIIERRLLLNLLDRLSLFVSEYESNSINLTFTPNKLNIESTKKTGDESISYKQANVTGLIEFNCVANILHMKDQLDALLSDDIKICFGGADNALMVIDGNVTQIISLMTGE